MAYAALALERATPDPSDSRSRQLRASPDYLSGTKPITLKGQLYDSSGQRPEYLNCIETDRPERATLTDSRLDRRRQPSPANGA